MAKAEKIPPQPFEPEILLTLSVKEAQVVKALLGRVSNDASGVNGIIWNAIQRLVPSRYDVRPGKYPPSIEVFEK